MSSTFCSPDPDLAALVRVRAGRRWCLFVDRDGVINRRVVHGYVLTPDQLELLPGAAAALAWLAAWAPYVVVVTNQQGIGKGLMSEADLDAIHDRLREQLPPDTVIDAVHCPHLAGDACRCRKPGTLLAEEWLADHPDCEAALSMVVGDAETDMEMAARLAVLTGGCEAVKIGPRSPLTRFAHDSLADFAAAVAAVQDTR